jgi:HPt (histidine-containing phosphotransfer) domain-containing protein
VTIQEQLRVLLTRHCASISADVDIIARSLSEVLNPNANQAASIKNALEVVHQIKGTSGSMGYPALSAAAERLEGCLKGLEPQAGRISEGDLQPVMTYLRALEQQGQSTTPEASPLYNVLNERAPANPAAETDP